MAKPALRQLLHQALRAARRALPGRPRARGPAPRSTRRPRIEALEDRMLPALLGPLAGFTPTPLTSDGTGGASQALTSYDGRFVVYSSTAANVVPGQVNTAVASNVFLYDALSKTTVLVSHVPGSPTTAADGSSDGPRVSSDGRYVVYESTAPNLVAGQAGPRGQENVFLYDTVLRTNTLVSGTYDPATGGPSATTTGNDSSSTTDTTGFGFADHSGRFLLFSSYAGDLAAGQDGPLVQNLFLYDTLDRTTTLVSHTADSTPGDQVGGDDDTLSADLTPDGRYVVFESLAVNLAAGQDPAHSGNVFLYSQDDGSVRLLSGTFDPSTGTNSPTAAAGSSFEPLISADGGLISFVSGATNLVADQAATNPDRATDNVFVYDNRPLLLGLPNPHYRAVSLVSGAYDPAATANSATRTGNDDSPEAVLSADGSAIAFISAATNLTGDAYPDRSDDDRGNVFLFDTSTLYAPTPTATLTLASYAADDPAAAAGGVYTNINDSFLDLSLSGNGNLVAYQSTADDLVAGQQGTTPDDGAVTNVFLYDWDQDQTALVSRAHGAPASTGNDDSLFSHVSGNGATVAFLSGATNVGAGDAGGRLTLGDSGQNLFAYDVAAASDPRLVSRSAFPALTTSLVWGSSADGRFVVFTSDDAHVVANQDDTNFAPDVFLLDRDTGNITLVSHVPGSATKAGDGGAPDTVAGGLGDGPVLSADGNWVAFVSDDTDLVPNEDSTGGGADQVYLFNRLTGQVTLVSHDAGATAADLTVGDDESFNPVVSADGRYVAYVSYADDLVAHFANPFDGESSANVYLYDRETDTTTLVSHDVNDPAVPDDTNPEYGGDSGSAGPTISDDGRYVAYASRASTLVSDTTYSVSNVYLFDRSTGRNTLVTRSSATPATGADDSSFGPVLSADGSTVAFTSFATDVAPGQMTDFSTDFTNVFLYRVGTGQVSLVSGSHGSPTASAAGYSDSPALNDDGSVVAFRSDAPDLLSGPVAVAGGGSNVFRFDPGQPGGPVVLLSHAAGSATTPAAGDSEAPAIDGAGDLVVYLSKATDLVPDQREPGTPVNNVFLYSTALSANGLVSGQGGSITTPGTSPAFQALISRDPVVAFNLLPAGAGTSVAQLNKLAELVLSPNYVVNGSPAGTLVGSLGVVTVFAGQYVRPRFQLGLGDDNASFALGGRAPDNTAPLSTRFTAGQAGRSSYTVLASVDYGFGLTSGALTVYVTSGPQQQQQQQPPGRRQFVRVLPVHIRRKTLLLVEVLTVGSAVPAAEFFAPFAEPRYRDIQLSLRDSNGDGVADLILFTARQGRRPVSAAVLV